MMIDAIILACWVISFFCNGIESGLLAIDPVRLRQNVKQRVPAALRLNRLLEHPQRLVVTVLICTNAADIVGLLLLTRQLVRALGPIGYILALLVAWPIYLFLLGVLPKALFRRFPFRALGRLAGLLEFLTFLLRPVTKLGGYLGAWLFPAAEKGKLFAAREELKQIATQSEREGSLTATERAMIHNVVDFRGVKVRDVMIPLSKVVSVRPDTPLSEVIALSASSGVDRLPIITPDHNSRGLVNVFDIIFDRETGKSLGNYTRRLVMATDQEPAYRIVQRLRAARIGLAGVLDPSRNLCGVVTIEDLVQRLVSSTEARG